MSEEPQLPPIPALGDALDRKERFVERVYSVVKCKDCQVKYTRIFKPGDYTFKALINEKCEKCKSQKGLSVEEIYSEWIDPKKRKL